MLPASNSTPHQPPPTGGPKKSPSATLLTPSASNPLLASSAFSLVDSFGTAAILAPTPQLQQPHPTQTSNATSGFLGSQGASRPSPTPTPPTLSKTSSSSSLASSNPLGPPPAGVFLLPSTTGASIAGTAPPPLGAPPPSSNVPLSSGGSARKSRYVAPPGIHASSASAAAPSYVQPSFVPPSSTTHPAVMVPDTSAPSAVETPSSYQQNPSAARAPPPAASFEFQTPTDYPYGGSGVVEATMQPSSPISGGFTVVQEVAHHWFYRVEVAGKEQWKPFTMIDSVAIEDVFLMDPHAKEPIPVEGGRYDISLPERTKTPVYWKQEMTAQIRRCSWFYKSNVDGRWTPYDEETSRKLESEYTSAVTTGNWNRRVDLEADAGKSEHIMLHSPSVMMHFPSNSSLLGGNLDDWGQVQPPQADPMAKPRVVHRGLEGLPEIPDGEAPEVDHLVFVVHGVGAFCDIRLRSIAEVVDGYRELTAELGERHFQSAHLSGRANRVEFLPVNWHSSLHENTDDRLDLLTLKSVPKLRNFVNDTLLDILFYTSPVHCQTIVDTVVSEINRMYTVFMARNESFSGQISVMGHSLGSIILFDVLSHQNPDDSLGVASYHASSDKPASIMTTQAHNADSPPSTTLSELFARLDIDQRHAETFAKEGIDFDALMTCQETDLVEAGMDERERAALLGYISLTRSGSGREDGGSPVRKSEFGFVMGKAGTGQPSVRYPRLCFQPASFYALGSPIGMFQAVRGVETLGVDFKLPTCPRFFNIFHPYDPVAYRIESLLDEEYAKLRPLVIPHHKGRKRMHLELRDTVTKLMTTDFKQKIINSVSATLSTVYNIATGNQQTEDGTEGDPAVQRALEDSMSKQAAENDAADAANPRNLAATLNSGGRVDFVLQEAPFESFNEYLFAMASHLCYWESEDTALMILKDIYEQLSIYPDDHHQQQPTKVGQALPPPPPTNFAPTPTIAPPPIPMGAPMSGPSVLQPSATPTIAPPPIPIGAPMAGPPVLQPSATPTISPPPIAMGAPMTTPSVLQPSATPTIAPASSVTEDVKNYSELQSTPTLSTTATLNPSANTYKASTPVAPPKESVAPQMFSPAGNGPSPIDVPPPMGPPPALASGASPLGPPPVMKPLAAGGSPYPKGPSYSAGAPPTIGMDPTAPPSSGRPLGPPPMGGFYKKN